MTPLFSVKECLRGYSIESLGQMCDRWNLAVSNPANRLKAIEKVLTDPLHVKKAVTELPAAEKRVLATIADRPQVAARDVLGVPALAGAEPMSQVLQSLATWGFVLALPREQHGTFGFNYFARAELNGSTLTLSVLDLARQALNGTPNLDFPLPPPADSATSVGALAEQPNDTATPLRPMGDPATDAVLEALRIVELLTPRVTATGEIHKSDATRAKELAAEAGLPPDVLALAIVMGRQTGCLDAKDGRLSVTPRADEWAGASAADRVRDMFTAYVKSEDLFDLHLFFPQIESAIDEHLPQGTLRRTYHKVLLARLLASLQPDTWYAIDAFADLVRRADPNVLFNEERWRAIASHTHDPTAAWRERSWQTHEKRLIAWTFQSVLARLGMVEIDNEGKLFRLTPVGIFALGIGPAPAQVETANSDALVVQPDFEVIAYCDKCAPHVRRRLDTFCERVRGGVVSTYRLTKDSVYRGLKTGVTLDEFILMLQRHSRRVLPANVIDQISTWERKAASVMIYTGCKLVECMNAEAAEKLATQDTNTRRIGDRFVLMNEAPEEIESRVDYATPDHRCLVQDDGLVLRAPWASSSLFVKRRLEEIGEVKVNADGDIVLTLKKEAMSGEVDWGLHVAALDSLVVEPLAPRYRTALRTWSGDANPPSVHTATLVRFDDADICASVMQLQDLAQYVEGRLGLYTVALKSGALAPFKRSLKALGLAIDRNGVVLDDGAPEDWAVRWVESQRPPQPTTEDAVKTVAAEKITSPEDDMVLPAYSPQIMREIIQDAIQRRRTLLLRYKSTWSPKPSVRRVNPVSLDTVGPVPSLSGYCHRLGGARVFKIAQISGIRVLEDERF